MKKTLEDLLVKYEDLVVIHCNNTSVINISKNIVMHSKTKHIPIKYHFLREQVSQKVVKLEYIDMKEQLQTFSLSRYLENHLPILSRNWGLSLIIKN